MKKSLLAVAVMFSALIASNNANAQVFEEGGLIMHLGIGVGSPYFYSGSKSSVPPVHISGEYGITDKIGVGGLIGYTASSWEQTYTTYDNNFNLVNAHYKWKFTYLVIGARGAYHFLENSEKTDLYAGVMLGANIAKAKFESNDPGLNSSVFVEPSVGGAAFGAFVGGRYLFTEKIGAFAELGYNISWLSVGLAVKM